MPPRSLAAMVALAGALVMAAAGCAELPTPSPAPRGPVTTLCQPDEGDLPVDYPPLELVAHVDAGATGVAVVAAPVPGDETLTYVRTCRYARTGAALHLTDGATNTVPTINDADVEVLQVLAVGGGANLPEAVVSGRAGDGVSRVVARLSDGSLVDAPISDGYFVAYWRGPADAEAIVALDEDGAELGAIEDPTGIVRHGGAVPN